MHCIRCGQETADGMDFDVVRVNSRKVKNPLGKVGRILMTEQEIVGFETFFVCDSCIDKKLFSINHFWSSFAYRFRFTFLFLIAGSGLVIRFYGTEDNGFLAGILCIAYFLVKLWKFVKTSGSRKASYAKFSETNARFVAAWECLCEDAQRRNEKGDTVFFIPVTKATYDMKKEDFSQYYRLTPANAEKLYCLLKQRCIKN